MLNNQSIKPNNSPNLFKYNSHSGIKFQLPMQLLAIDVLHAGIDELLGQDQPIGVRLDASGRGRRGAGHGHHRSVRVLSLRQTVPECCI